MSLTPNEEMALRTLRFKLEDAERGLAAAAAALPRLRDAMSQITWLLGERPSDS